MTAGQFLELVAGLAMLALAGIGWSGLWRRWAQSPFLRAGPITVIPGLGFMFVFVGVDGVLPPAPLNALGAATFLALFGGLVLLAADPDWFGPRWYRRFKRAFGPEGERGTFAWMAEDARRPGETSVEATQRHLFSDRPLPPATRGYLISDPVRQFRQFSLAESESSILLFYPQAPGWAGHTSDGVPVNETIATESLQGVRKLNPGVGLDGAMQRGGWRSYLVPRVRIDTADGPWLFETRHAKDIVREVERRYLDPSRDMYGFPLEESQSATHDGRNQPTDAPNRAKGQDGREPRRESWGRRQRS